MSIKHRLLALLCLALLTTVLPEMLSGNTAAEVLFQPDVFLFFALAYALPIILIRDWAMRLHLSYGGIFLAGMAYGVINEGLLAKTLFIEAGGPIDVFDHYGFAFGVNFPWALCILVWHGLSSVLFPIVLTHFFVPQAADQPWLGKKTSVVLAGVAVLLASLFYTNDASSGTKGNAPLLAALWMVIALLAILAARQKGSLQGAAMASRWKPFLFGLVGLFFFFAILLVARSHVPVAVYLAAFAALAALWIFILRRYGWHRLPALGRVALGWYVQMAGFGWVSMVHRSQATVALGAAILLLLHWLCLRAERQVV